MQPFIIIIGASTRAAARSAVRAGFVPYCIDLFADRDLQTFATAVTCPIDRYPQGMVDLLREAPKVDVVYTGAMENHLAVLEAIEQTHALRGCSPESVRAVRDPAVLGELPPFPRLRACSTRTSVSLFGRLQQLLLGSLKGDRYLVKPRRSAGGTGIGFWSPLTAVDDEHYLQQFIPGRPISAAFVCDGWSARLLGVTEQIIGDEQFGASGFQYAGSLGPIQLDGDQIKAIHHLGVSLAQRFDLRGPVGVDAVIDNRGNIRPVEVNPRYTAGMEILERAISVSAFGASIVRQAEPSPGSFGKAVVFAQSDTTIPDLYESFTHDEIADVPEIGENIPAGKPVCTLFAHAPTRDQCLSQLHDKATKLYTRLR